MEAPFLNLATADETANFNAAWRQLMDLAGNYAELEMMAERRGEFDQADRFSLFYYACLSAASILSSGNARVS